MRKVLDFGCGIGNNKHNIYDNKKYDTYGIDIDPYNIKTCKKKFPKSNFQLVNPADKLPFNDNSFDLIHSLDVLEHVDDLYFVLNEIKRVSKDGALFIIEVPYYKSEKFLLKINKNYWSQVHHVRMFRKNELEELLFRFGFTIIKRKRLNFIENVNLGYLLKYGNIINQKGDFNIKQPYFLVILTSLFNSRNIKTKITSFKSLVFLFLLIMFYPINYILSYIFPKSIYFKFKKITNIKCEK